MNKEWFKYLIKLIICFLLFYFVGDTIKWILTLLNIDITNKLVVLLQLICSSIILIVLILLYKKDIKEELRKVKKDKEKVIGYILKMFLIFMVVKFLVGILSGVLLLLFNMDIESLNSVNQSTIEILAKESPLLIFISSSILAPVYEELLFRLGIKRVIKNKYVFMITSGLIFGLLHIFPLSDGITLALGLIQSITYVTMGVFLAYTYESSDSIVNSIGVHFLNNLLSILVVINGI